MKTSSFKRALNMSSLNSDPQYCIYDLQNAEVQTLDDKSHIVRYVTFAIKN